jgi:chromosome segregation and condensation protein ScpB
MKRQDVDKFLDALKDGERHIMEETLHKTKIEEHKARLIVSFLLEFQFIQMDKKTGRTKLCTSTKEFLEKLGEIDSTSFYEEITA